MGFWDQIVVGWTELPRNLPSMAIEVFVLGGLITLITAAFANLGERRALARILNNEFDEFVATTKLAIVKLQNKEYGDYEDCRRALASIASNIDQQYKIYHKVLGNLAIEFKEFRDLIVEFRQDLHVQNSVNQSEDQFLEVILSRIEGKYSKDDAFCTLNRKYNELISSLWGWLTFHFTFPRKLKTFKSAALKLDAAIKEMRMNSGAKPVLKASDIARAEFLVRSRLASIDSVDW